ncbi:hypothetical protein NXC24_PB00476 (plasmid) [Rhizobium sp. NXC24]|nr:hypothetical protein NXC24_PB00476 [Rhizobium sp. NXC24]
MPYGSALAMWMPLWRALPCALAKCPLQSLDPVPDASNTPLTAAPFSESAGEVSAIFTISVNDIEETARRGVTAGRDLPRSGGDGHSWPPRGLDLRAVRPRLLALVERRAERVSKAA